MHIDEGYNVVGSRWYTVGHLTSYNASGEFQSHTHYSEDGKSTGEFDITRGLRSEREYVCVCVCVMVIRGCVPKMRMCK